MKEQSNLQKCLSAANYSCDSYSGRGMYGVRCLSTTVKADSSASALLSLAVDIVKESHSLLDSDDIDGLDFDDILVQVKNARVDSMGRGYVVYFPAIDFCDDSLDDTVSAVV